MSIEKDPLFREAVSLHQKDLFREALEQYYQLLRKWPKEPLLLCNLGSALSSIDREAAAESWYLRALKLDENNPATLRNYGNLLRKQGRFTLAEQRYQQLLTVHGDRPETLMLAGMLYRDWHKPVPAIRYFSRADQIKPNVNDAQWELARMFLEYGDYTQGFARFDARFNLEKFPTPQSQAPIMPPGMDVRDQRLLITAEQGFGDNIQFSRFIPLMASRVKELIWEVPGPLFPLFKPFASHNRTIIVQGEKYPPHDLQLPIMSLADRLQIHQGTLPLSFLTRPSQRTPEPPLRIGLIWSGKPTPTDRSIGLDTLLPMLSQPGFNIFSFQLGDKQQALGQLYCSGLIEDLSPKLGHFADTAALMQKMDLIISVDTGPAHLAASLGLPTWVLVHWSSDWRWRHSAHRCLWYPNVRQFCQQQFNDWSTPLDELAQALDTQLFLLTRKQVPGRSAQATDNIEMP